MTNNTEANYFIAVDWGTTALKAFLCSNTQNGVELLDFKTGTGVKFCQYFEQELLSIINPWVDKYQNMPVIICGMAGSNIGWKHVDYVSCPTKLCSLNEKSIHFNLNNLKIKILPGLSCKNILNMPDFIRGEETQIAGWVKEHSDIKQATLLCLPGTHTKWAVIKDGTVETFLSSLQGEMFDILSKYSVICPTPKTKEEINEDAFYKGAIMAKTQTDISILHQLFSIRAQQIQSDLSAIEAYSFLSGLLITNDILGAVKIFFNKQNLIPSITIIGNIQLIKLYNLSAKILDIDTYNMNADKAIVSGIDFIYNSKNDKRI